MPGDPPGCCLIDDLFGAVVAYEVFSLASRRVPPITTVARSNRWTTLPVLAVIGLHLLRRPISNITTIERVVP